MNHDIQAIFLDVGNTLRIVVKDEPFQAQARHAMMELVGSHEPVDAFLGRLETRWRSWFATSSRS